MDKVCEIYSECEEWKLKDESDINHMARYLERFLTSQECRLYLEGRAISLLQLPCIKR